MSAALDINVTGLDSVAKLLEELPEDIKNDADDALEKTTDDIVEEARRLVPVRTGFLRSSIYKVKPRQLHFIVGAFAHYAGYVEFGTSRMHPQPYLYPAIWHKLPLLYYYFKYY